MWSWTSCLTSLCLNAFICKIQKQSQECGELNVWVLKSCIWHAVCVTSLVALPRSPLLWRGRSRRLREPASIPSPKSLIFTCSPFICILQPIHEHNLFSKKPHFLPPYQHLSAQQEGFPFCSCPTESPHSWGSRHLGLFYLLVYSKSWCSFSESFWWSPFPLYFHCPCFYHLRCGLPSLYHFSAWNVSHPSAPSLSHSQTHPPARELQNLGLSLLTASDPNSAAWLS